MTINECIRAIERDRREPDKVLCTLASLRRAMDDLRRDFENERMQEVWNALYIDRRLER